MSLINLILKIEEVVQDVVRSLEKKEEVETIGVITKTISSTYYFIIIEPKIRNTIKKDHHPLLMLLRMYLLYL